MTIGRHFNPGFRLCGACSWITSSIYLLLSAQWVFIAWKQLGSSFPVHRASPTSLFGFVLAVAILARLTTDAASLRDRLVVWLGLLGFAMDFLIGAWPAPARPLIAGARTLYLAMSIAAAFASLSLLYSALRATPPRNPDLRPPNEVRSE